MRSFLNIARHLLGAGAALAALLLSGQAQAVTYANASYPFSWVDSSTHAKLGYNTSPYKLQALSGCATSPPTTDDTMSDLIPLNFNFTYGGVVFTNVRVMTNGRLHFNGNVTCGAGSPVTQLPYPNTTLNYTMRIYGNDLDPTNKVDVPSYNTPCVNKAVCYISYATLGTAPYRTFVVTWANIPEWTTGSNPTGNYNLQLILQENGEFIYQYGSDVPGPSNSLAQVGWQVDSNDYDTPPNGFPNNTAIKFFIPQPVAEYRMEQSTLLGGQALDTSGNGRHGTFVGTALTDPAGKICRGALFPSNTSAATISGLNTNISATTLGGAGMIDFWYKSNTAWSSKDTQLLDATVARPNPAGGASTVNAYFFLVKRATGQLRFVITDATGANQIVETSGLTVGANTWKHIALSWNFNNLAAAGSDHMRIYVDGVLSKEQVFTAGSGPYSNGTLFVGDNRSSLIGLNGSGNSADGAIDELRLYNYEGGLALVQRDFNATAYGCLAHYKVADAGSGLTCQLSTVTVTAHDSNHLNFIMPNNTTQIQLRTSTGKGDWSLVSGYGVLDNGVANDGLATYRFNGEYQAVFALAHTVAGTVNINVTDGQIVELEDQSLTISECVSGGFDACELKAPRCVPDAIAPPVWNNLYTKLAGTAFKIDAVKLKPDRTLDTGFNNTVGVALLASTTSIGGGVLDADGCPSTPTAVIPLGNVVFSAGYGPSTGIDVGATALSAVAPGYTSYRDVRVRMVCAAADCGTRITSCSMDNFAIRPLGFSLASATNNATQTGTPAVKAGAAFTLTASASAGYDGSPLIDNTLTGQKIVGHLGASDYTGSLGDTTRAVPPVSIPQASIANGVATIATMKYDDVGNFRILAGGVRDANFTVVDKSNGGCVAGNANTADAQGRFGCDIANQSDSALFGRFYPDHFDLSYGLSNACNGFSYMGQAEFGADLLVTAMSAGNVALSHYSAASLPATNYPSATVKGVNVGTAAIFSPLSTRLLPDLPGFTVGASAAAWNGGKTGRYYTTDAGAYPAGSTTINLSGAGPLTVGDMVRFVGDATRYAITSVGTTPVSIDINPVLSADLTPTTPMHTLHSFLRAGAADGPYDAFSFSVTVTDKDGALFSTVNGVPIAPAATALAGSPVAGGAVRLRYGRLRIDNMYGSERLSLPVPVLAQYSVGPNLWQTSTLDNCTRLLASNFSLVYRPGGVLTAINMPAAKIPVDSGTLAAGVGSVRLSPPNLPLAAPNKGNVQLLFTPSYLPGLGTETFGVYKNGPVIYLQEVH